MRIAEEPHKLKPLQVAMKEKIIELEQGRITYEIKKNETVRIQIRLAIQNHFVKQMNILRAGRKIKTLTLFFIDSIDIYTRFVYTDYGIVNSILKAIPNFMFKPLFLNA